MPLRIESCHRRGAVVLVPQVFEEGRSYFLETHRADDFKALGLPHVRPPESVP